MRRKIVILSRYYGVGNTERCDWQEWIPWLMTRDICDEGKIRRETDGVISYQMMGSRYGSTKVGIGFDIANDDGRQSCRCAATGVRLESRLIHDKRSQWSCLKMGSCWNAERKLRACTRSAVDLCQFQRSASSYPNLSCSRSLMWSPHDTLVSEVEHITVLFPCCILMINFTAPKRKLRFVAVADPWLRRR